MRYVSALRRRRMPYGTNEHAEEDSHMQVAIAGVHPIVSSANGDLPPVRPCSRPTLSKSGPASRVNSNSLDVEYNVVSKHRRVGSRFRFRHGPEKKKQALLVDNEEEQRRERDMAAEEEGLLDKGQGDEAHPSPANGAPSTSKYSRFFRTPRIGSRRIRNRLVQKQGICNISLKNVPKQRRKYFSDIFTTIIETKWRWCLLVFLCCFCSSWFFFSCIYYMLSLSHGKSHDSGTIAGRDFVQRPTNDTWRPCIANVNVASDHHGEKVYRYFLNCFLFSFTTQTTIGYGFRYPTDECPSVVMTMCFQFMWGVMSQTLMAGVVFSKLARPIKRAATLIFSKNAVICLRDGKLCLLFRVGDMRKSSLAEAHVRLQMIKRCITYEGELLPFHQFDMDVGYDQGLDRVFVIWPITICHEIDERSPLYDISQEALATAKFEIIAILEGVVESVGSTTQARTSYLPSEILWGKRFEKLVHYKKENGQYNIDFSKFHNVYDIRTPSCSAKELDELRQLGLFDESEYQLVPTDAKGCLRVIENDQLGPLGKVEEIDGSLIPMLSEPPAQVLRIDSDCEDNDEEEDHIELVEYGFRKKSTAPILSEATRESLRQKLSLRSSHVSLIPSPSQINSFDIPLLEEANENDETPPPRKLTVREADKMHRRSHQELLMPPSPRILVRQNNSLPPSPPFVMDVRDVSDHHYNCLLPTRPASHALVRASDSSPSPTSSNPDIPTSSNGHPNESLLALP